MPGRWRSLILPLFILLGFSLACLCLPLSEIPSDLERVEPEVAVTQEPGHSCSPGMVFNPDTQACEAHSDCTSWLAHLEEQFRYPPETDEDAPAYDEEILLVSYRINAGQIRDPVYENVPAYLETYQDDRQGHEAIWGYFTVLFPQNTWHDLAAFVVMTDGEDNSLAAIERSWDNPDKWDLYVDVMDASDIYELTTTLIHEFGHLLTLNTTQMDPDKAERNCSTYYAGDGCSLPGAYLTDFFNLFWPDIYNEWIDMQYIEDDDDYYDALEDFYWQYRDQFVTDYAATSPDEDIAEAWTLFILAPAPGGKTLAEQKILFFYGYPELVNLREAILSQLCANIP